MILVCIYLKSSLPSVLADQSKFIDSVLMVKLNTDNLKNSTLIIKIPFD